MRNYVRLKNNIKKDVFPFMKNRINSLSYITTVNYFDVTQRTSHNMKIFYSYKYPMKTFYTML